MQQMIELTCHPDTPPSTVTKVAVQLAKTDVAGELWLEYHVTPSQQLRLPAEGDPVRANDLWMATCFELFAQPVSGEGYFEFNFSPSFKWAAYAFDGYRRGMRDFPSQDPEIVISSAGSYFFLAVEAMPALPFEGVRIGLSAVIEERDGTKSYWALNHPPGAPDFHHPDCFALQLPAPERP